MSQSSDTLSTQTPDVKPCEPPKHRFDVKDGKLVSDVCRCKQYDRRKKMMR